MLASIGVNLNVFIAIATPLIGEYLLKNRLKVLGGEGLELKEAGSELTSALLTSKNGFSVVAPIKITVPFSTQGSSASC